ncbi:alpha,alpha-phosphotrehalase [Paludibacterium yongneupense]|uniref:alpha,alpha-phosphotrehalase n=1 Tax=Paludibacterium yongneupense TaxID=400061 RepID=UPI000403A630|nr:alpha,alpha-phosphotrehalase [Paludibacterium yongneupense]
MNAIDYKHAVVYQIYPKSFCSHAGHATGDIAGILTKLDYLSWLGVDYLWLTPVYASPQRDNGYDISDYYAIDPAYGSMGDLERLIAAARDRGIGIVMDIVVNHTSTDHAWFKAACESRDNPYRDYYLWRDQPNGWQSKFGGSAWHFHEATGQYYLHLFDKTQADLNWRNPRLRAAIFEMMRFWADKGIAGFRLDVINLISKDPTFADDDGDGRSRYTDGPAVHDYLQAMHREVFAGRELLTVGEMSSTRIDECVRYSNPERRELTMTFSFHHLKVDYPGGDKWQAAPFDFIELKRILSEWQTGMHDGGGWNALFWCNHDQPRVVSRFGDDGAQRVAAAKMLATALHLLQGTPYIYQGEEIGMRNPGFADIDSYRDVETLNIYREKVAAGVARDDIMAAIRQKSRDNGRTPMPWNDSLNGGFSTGEPWISLAPDWHEVNVEAARRDPDSVVHRYRELIALRKSLAVVRDGRYRCLSPDHARIWAYTRELADERLLVVCNFYGSSVDYRLTDDAIPRGWRHETLFGGTAPPPLLRLGPYEALVWRLRPYQN